MSTKTLRKRIALVAVSAMGFGLLSTVPAFAGDVDATSIASATMAPVRAGDTKNVTVNLAFSTWASGDTVTAAALVHARTLSAPTGATAFDTGAGVNSTVYESSADLNGIATTGTASATAGAATIRMAVPVAVTPSAAGTYTILVWYDAAGNSTAGPTVTSPQTTVTFTVAGAPATINLDSTAKSGSAGGATGGTFGFTLKDAAGLPTYLKSGETLSGSVSDVSPNVSGGTLFVANGSTADISSGNATTKSITVSDADGTGAITVATTTAGIARARIVGSGLLTGVVPAVTADYTTVAYIYGTKLKLSTTTGVSNASASTGAPTVPAEINGTGTGSVWASNSSSKSLSYLVTAGSAGTAQYTIAAIDSLTSLPTGVTAGTSTVTIVDNGASASPRYTGALTIAATAATAGSGYKLTVGTGAATNMVYTVIYQAPTVNSSNGYVTVAPTTANAAKTLRGGSATITATVRDQFGDAFAGANVVWTVSGRNTYTAAGTSNASGVATYTVADASTSTTSLTDSVVATAAAPTATTYTSNVAASATTSLNYVSSVTVTSLTLTNNAVSATAIAGGSTPTAPDADVTLTATAKDALGTVMSGIPVTFTLPTGGYVAPGTSLTVYTDSSGVATLVIDSTLTGTNTASATAGGATATSAYTIANAATNGRVITIDKAALSVSAASAGQVTVTVKDRYGNLVGGAAFSVSYIGTAGRVSAVNGVVAASGTTGATSGTATVDLSSNSSEAGTGTLTVTLTSPDASTSTLMANGAAYTALVKSVTSAITVGASKSAEVLAIEAAAAEAAATAKANAEAAAATAKANAEAAAAKAAADKASQDAAIAALKAQLDAAAVKAAADKAASDAAIKAAQDAAVAASKAAQDAAVAAAKAAQDAAVEAATAATDAAQEALDAANAATDAANASAEAGDAATAAAQDAADAVAALSVQVSEMITSLKKQITALTNLIIKIQKKVKA